MIATLFPSPTLLSVFEDARRGALEAMGFGKKAIKARAASRTPRDIGLMGAKAFGWLSIKAVVPLVVRDAIERRRGQFADGVEAEPLRVAVSESVLEAAVDLIPEDVTWRCATQPIVEAQMSAQEVFRLQSEAGEHIDAASYALEGMLGDLKLVMPGIKMRSAKLHKVNFRTSREAEGAEPRREPIPLRAVRAA